LSTSASRQALVERALVLDPRDNVATALYRLEAQAAVLPIGTADLAPVVLREPVALCHKFALHAIARGEAVIKYGQPIGFAAQAIAAGEHVHTHNLTSAYAVPGAAG
jgi:altronate hydrolase